MMSYSTVGAAGDMFGGGDVSLQDILRRVSQELENEGMQGISGGLSSQLPAVVTTVFLHIPACYYIGHPASKTLFI